MRFKLVQYNIWHGTHFDRVVEFLKREQAEVVCVQEIGTKGKGFAASGENMVEDLARELGYYAEFVQALEVGEDGEVWNFGVAVFSRWPIVEQRQFLYGGATRQFISRSEFNYNWPTALLWVRVEGINVPIVTTHLPVTRHTVVTEKQMAEAREVREFLCNEPELVLCGDMNTLPHSGAYEILAKDLVDVTDSALPTLHPSIHPVGLKNYHVDYVFYKSDRLKHISTRIPIVSASDHLPLVVEFEYA